MKRPKNGAGFTLLEMLTVISIISLIINSVFAAVSIARTKAQDVKRIHDLQQISKALEMYYDDHGKYPDTSVIDEDDHYFDFASDWNTHTFLEVLVPDYFISHVPKDPSKKPGEGGGAFWNFIAPNHPNLNYAYGATNDGKSYMLVTQLETPNHPLSVQNTCEGRWTGGWPTPETPIKTQYAWGLIISDACCGDPPLPPKWFPDASIAGCSEHTSTFNTYVINSSYFSPTCGNNIVESGETCDDGNTQSGDGCSSTCQIE